MKKCRLNNNKGDYCFFFFLFFLITEHPGVPLAPLPSAPTVCLSVHLSTSIPQFFFHSPCQLSSKSPSVHVCLSVSISPSLVSTLCAYCIFVQISSKNHSCPLFPLRPPHPSLIFLLPSLFLLVWVNADKQQASPGLPVGLISAGRATELRQIDDKACQGSSLLFKDRLHLKARAPCG